jgi:hypothetical protein
LGGKCVCPAQHNLSEDFILKLSELCNNEELSILMGGDFNLIRSNKDRNKGQGDPRLIELFNNFIGTFQLREIFISGSRFTWSNKQRDPTLIKLDRILMSESWENNFPTCFAWSKARVVQITVHWF